MNFIPSAVSHKTTMWCHVVPRAMLWEAQLGVTRDQSVKEQGWPGTPKTELIVTSSLCSGLTSSFCNVLQIYNFAHDS